MVQRKIKKDITKMFQKYRKIGNKIIKSTLVLYTVLLLAVMNLFIFVQKEDNESLFLFLVVSAIMYTQTTNMIVVLLVPLIFVNLLIYLRRIFLKRREGFDIDTSMEDFNKWIESNISKEEPTDDSEGLEFYKKKVKPVIDIKNLTSPTLEDIKNMMSLYTSLSEMSEKEPSESTYINNMVDDFVKSFDNNKDKSNKEESETDTEKVLEESDDTTDNTKIKESFTYLESFDDDYYEDEYDYDSDEY